MSVSCESVPASALPLLARRSSLLPGATSSRARAGMAPAQRSQHKCWVHRPRSQPEPGNVAVSSLCHLWH